MGTAYYDPRSVSLRLDKTICIYKGEPVFVEVDNPPERRQRVDPETGNLIALPPDASDAFHILKMYKLDGRLSKPTKVDYREPEFDYRAFPLGYINFMGSAFYLRRVPSRVQKQGLDKHFVASEPVGLQGSNWFFSKDMKDCILGIYPSVAEAMQSIDLGKAESVGVRRNFAISFSSGGAHRLNFKGREIAYMSDGEFILIHRKERDAMSRIIRAEFKEDELCLRHVT